MGEEGVDGEEEGVGGGRVAEIGDDDARAESGEVSANCGADAAGAAGDDGDAVLER